MEISLQDIAYLYEKILTHAKNNNLMEIKLDSDYYYTIDSSYAANLDLENPKIIIGSLVDDWSELQTLLTNHDQPSIVDFERLGNIIRFIGDAISKSENVY